MTEQVREIAERYKLIRLLGTGGMSEVYLAEDTRLHRQWAAKKVMHGDTPEQRWKAGRSLAEASLMRRLDHPGFPRIADRFEEEQCTWIIMDFVEGITLEELVRREGGQSEARVRIWARQLCDMLAYLHALEPPVIYRDMKPSNIIYRSGSHLRLIDFGIAAECSLGSTPPEPVGTRGYAAPEQASSGWSDARSDLYALGMTMHFLLTGAAPDGSPAVRPQTRLEDEFGLLQVIRKCTEQDPRRRYQSSEELMRDLLRPERLARQLRWKKRRRQLLQAAAIAAAVCISMGVVFRRGVNRFIAEETYAAKLQVQETVAADARERAYLDAIRMQPESPDAYEKLLELYETDGVFEDDRSRTLLEQVNQGRFYLADRQEIWRALLYRTGRLYFLRFTGGDGSGRERILRAEPFFAEWSDAGGEESDTSREDCLCAVCSFYKTYMTGMIGIDDPDRAKLEAFLRAVSRTLEELDAYEGHDAAAVRMTVLQELAGTVNAWRYAICAAGIPLGTARQPVEQIRTRAEALEPGLPETIAQKDALIADCATFLAQMEYTWAAREQEKQRGHDGRMPAEASAGQSKSHT